MRIDIDKFPALFEDFNNHYTIVKDYPEWDAYTKQAINRARTNVNFISDPFWKAATDSLPKIIHLKNDLNTIDRTVLIAQPNISATYIYSVRKTTEKTALFGLVGFKCRDNKDYIIPFGVVWDPSMAPDEIYYDMVEFGESPPGTVANAFCIEMFLQHAEIETKHLPPSRQIYDGPTCLYNNKTQLPINIIDSTWFTTLVKSDAFKVRGHFRLQPCGEGRSKRKLVWINDFQKEGYTRTAKKELI